MAVAAGGAGGTEATEAWHGVLQTRIARGKPWEVVCPLSAPATPLKLPRELQVRALERDPRRMPSGPPSFEIRCGAVGGDVRGHRKYVEYLKYLAAGLQGRSGPKAAVVVLPGVNLFLMPPEDYSAVTADTPLVVMWRESGQGGPPQFVSASAAGMNSTEDGPPAKKRSRVEVQNSSSVTPTGAAGTFAKLEPVALAALRGTAVTRLVDALEAAITEASGFAGEAPLVRAAMTHGVAAAVRPWVGHWLLSQRALAAVSSIGDAVLPSAPARDPQLRAELEYAGLMDVDAPLTALEQACEKEAAALVAKHRELSQSSEPWHSGVDVSEDPAGDGCILTCEGHQVRLSEEEAQRMAQLALGAAASGAAPSGHELMAATFASVARADILHGRTTSSTEAIGTLLVPSPVCDVLASQLGVHHECFTTPIDTYFTSFCSAAPDVDAPFGSAGDFFRFRPTSGSYLVCPPRTPVLLAAMVRHVLDLLAPTAAAGAQPLCFVVVVPAELSAEWYVLLDNSAFKVDLIAVDRARLVRRRSRGADVVAADCAVAVLQNPTARAKWRLTPRRVELIRTAMTSTETV